jgi:RNA polymerase sigma factor (sigma-70 family)
LAVQIQGSGRHENSVSDLPVSALLAMTTLLRQQRHGPLIESRPVSAPSPISELLVAAAAGDGQAWGTIVERYQRLLWSVVRGYRLDESAAADVVQTVWLRLVENLNKIREPERLPSWLATTARNEALRVSRAQQRQTPTDFEFDLADPSLGELDDRLLDDELEVEVMAAFRQLKPEHQHLLRLLTTDPPLDYSTVAELWGRPQGSIGPTKGRCIEQILRIMGRHNELGTATGDQS